MLFTPLTTAELVANTLRLKDNVSWANRIKDMLVLLWSVENIASIGIIYDKNLSTLDHSTSNTMQLIARSRYFLFQTSSKPIH